MSFMSIVKFPRLTVAIVFSLILGGCSNVNRLYLDSIKLAFFDDGPSLTLQEVQENKADLLKVVHGERWPAYMALAYVEDDQYKWISSDQVVLAMHKDKIIRTSGLNNNLQYTDNLAGNPLALSKPFAPTSWLYHIDAEDKSYGLPVTSRWQNEAPQQVTFFAHSLTVIPIIETVSVDIDEPYWTHKTSWQNVYWMEQDTKLVIYSEQLATPYSDPMKMTFVTRIGRIIASKEAN